ncbi:hypothetical protein PG991_001631 [Apiospora marii]|uniref:LysM domain-containing protein n=1 Tax=Apiospora marii TaxID=335849 RepID=A0ABR1SQ79_9PEZI
MGLFAVLLLLGLAHGQIQLLDIPSRDGISASCISVLNQQVACDENLARAGDAVGGAPVFGTPLFLTSSQLTSLCTSTCSSNLALWEQRVGRACGTTLFEQPDGGQEALVALPHNYVELFNSICLKNAAGEYCNDVMGKALHIDPVNQQASETPGRRHATTVLCNDCYLSIISTQLAMPLASTSLLASDFTQLTSSCKKTGWTLSPPPTGTTYSIRPTANPATPNCTGTQHVISGSDSCVGISMAEGISTDDLARENQIPSFCYQFPKTGSLCIPANRKCKPYTVKSTDTCASLQSAFGIKYAQLISWNPTLGPKCNNLASVVGYVICATTPGGAWVNPNPAPVPTTSWATGTMLWSTELAAPMSAYPEATYVAKSAPPPYANRTRLDCAVYVTAPVLTNYTGNGTTSLDCQDVAAQYGIDLADFVDWNPSLEGVQPCRMAIDIQYCAQTYSRVSPGIVGACVQREVAPAGYDCHKFTAGRGLEPDQFVLWNPDVGGGCERFRVGTSYCVAVHHYAQPGITSNCNKLAMANETDWVRNPCQIIETQFGVSHARFVAWNPAVQTNCSGLYRGYDYCVSIPGYKPTYTTPSAGLAPVTGLGSASLLAEPTASGGLSAEETVSSSSSSSNEVITSRAVVTPTVRASGTVALSVGAAGVREQTVAPI